MTKPCLISVVLLGGILATWCHLFVDAPFDFQRFYPPILTLPLNAHGESAIQRNEVAMTALSPASEREAKLAVARLSR